MDRRLRSEWWLDGAIAGGLGVILLLGGLGTRFDGPLTALDMLCILALLFRRRLPELSFGAITLLVGSQAIITDQARPGNMVFAFSLYAISAYGKKPWPTLGLIIGFIAAIVAATRWTRDIPQETRAYFYLLILLVVIVLASWFGGSARRLRRLQFEGFKERALQLERERDQQATIVAAQERARIAREMHDVVAHGLSVMIVQADGALHASRGDDPVAQNALRTISKAGRASLSEMRQLLGILRESVSDEAAYRPVPTASDIPQLIEQARNDGVKLTADISGDLTALNPAAGLTTYRVIQEGLTNIRKHSGPDVNVELELSIDDATVAIRILDDGRGVSSLPDGSGHGLVGISERVALHGGTANAGPRQGGGFALEVEFTHQAEEQPS